MATGESDQATFPVRSVGFWMAIVLVVFVFVNVFRSLTDPAGFASYFGTPLLNESDTGFVLVYTIRSLFLGLFGAALVVGRHFRLLALYALIGAVMPLGDAVLVASRGGDMATVVRHIAITLFMVVTAFLLWWSIRHTNNVER